VVALSPKNVWVFGGGGAGPGYGTYHYNDTTWTAQGGAIAGASFASVVSASDIWAVGSDGNAPQNTIVQYTGNGWSKVVSHSLDGMTFHAITALAAKSVWMTASVAGGSSFTSYLLHYNGGGVSKAKIPWSVNAGQVASDGQGGIWMLATDSGGVSYAIHVTPNGVWTRVPIGAGAGLAAVPGTTAEWAVGAKLTTSGSNAVIWAYGRPQ
jgi:hypothetical protein